MLFSMVLFQWNSGRNFAMEKINQVSGRRKMKKILFLASLLFFSGVLFGNPVPLPHAMISEFQFDPISKWRLEIGFGSLMIGSEYVYLHDDYDSICLVTSYGMARIKLGSSEDSMSLLVITPDSLSTPLSINGSGDCIKVYSYLSKVAFGGMLLTDTLSFGNYMGSVCDSIPTGYSICRFYFYYNAENTATVFCLSKKPTIGTPNDTSGCCATMTGVMFDKNNKKIINWNFTLDYPITFFADSTFSTSILARKCNFSGVFQTMSTGGWSWQMTDTVAVDAYPDSVIKRDIHFTDLVGIKEKPAPPNPDLYIINYPNPFNPGTNFYVRIPDDSRRKSGRIEVYNSIGQRVFVVPLSGVSTYKWDGVDTSGKAVASGVYYYRLVFDNAIYKTGSMILLK